MVLRRFLAAAAGILILAGPATPAAGAALPVGKAPAADAVTPLDHAHAHNDYLNGRPLQDALDHGFTSVEADVFLRDGSLVLCHQYNGDVCEDDDSRPATAKPFVSTYLQGLNARVNANGGRVYPGYHQPVFLFVEIKCVENAAGKCILANNPDQSATSPNNPLVVANKIINSLAPYQGMLYHFDGTARRWGPVQVVITGGHVNESVPVIGGGNDTVRGLLAKQTDRYAFLDGSFGTDKDQDNADLVPVISFQDEATDGCVWDRDQSVQNKHWDDIVTAQQHGHHVRAWDLVDCPGRGGLDNVGYLVQRNNSWTDALYGGVDYLSSDHLTLLGDWLDDNAAGGGGGDCAVPAWIASARLYGQYCTLWTGNVPVLAGRDPDSQRVGTLTDGGSVNWFLGQEPGEANSYGSSTNFWWAYTQADNGQWGWVSLVYFAGGGPDQSADGLQYACYDVRPGEPDYCHPL